MLLLVDLDGVVYRGAQPVPGIPAVLAARVAAGDDVVYVTNNSMLYRADYVTRLEAMGAPVSPDRIITSARAMALYLRDLQPPIQTALVVGGAGLACAADAVRAGARFVVTNRDPVYPLEKGLMPGSGAIVAAIETASGRTPISIGKPGPLLLQVAAHAVGTDVAQAVMIGDSVVTDVPAARAVGARSVLMLTGVTTRAEVAALPASDRPTEIAADAAELGGVLDRLAGELPGLVSRRPV
jgi:ribonucleotide monophosphatase NagD (HAD superfamily)